MATKESGWYARHSATVTESNSSATVLVKAYWQNDGWTYQIGWLNAWVYCNGSKVQVASNGSIDTTSSGTASAKLGEHTYTITKTTSSQSLPCKCKIESTGTYVTGTKYSTEANVSVSALASYTVSYNANGGSGAPSNQTKWYGQNLTLSSSTPSRTGHTFAGWNTNSSGTGTNYSAGGSYTGNAALTLYAKWTPHTYTVSYNANGGSGAPGNQTKTYGVNLTLSSTKPTRTNYNFLGWSTSANGGVVYASGATYTNNSAVTLYAVWELAYVKPRLTNFTANRCNSSGTINESGTYIKVTFNWATDRTVSAIKIEHKTQSASSWTSTTVSASGTSGSVSQIIGGGGISTETSYTVQAYVSDSGGTTYSPTVSIGTVKFPIDFKAGGTGVAIGKVAEQDNLFDVGMNAKFRNNVNAEAEIVKEGGYYQAYRGYCSNANSAITHGYYSTNPDSANIPSSNKYGSLETVESRGKDWVYGDGGSWVWQTFKNTGGETYTRYGVNSSSMSAWSKQVTLDMVYPVGSIYMSVNTTNPGNLFGGTWARITGRFLLAADDSSYKIGGTGGAATVTLTVAQMPKHKHYGVRRYTNGTAGSGSTGSSTSSQSTDYYTDEAGGDQAHNNMPPYLVVYVWKRTA